MLMIGKMEVQFVSIGLLVYSMIVFLTVTSAIELRAVIIMPLKEEPYGIMVIIRVMQ